MLHYRWDGNGVQTGVPTPANSLTFLLPSLPLFLSVSLSLCLSVSLLRMYFTKQVSIVLALVNNAMQTAGGMRSTGRVISPSQRTITPRRTSRFVTLLGEGGGCGCDGWRSWVAQWNSLKNLSLSQARRHCRTHEANRSRRKNGLCRQRESHTQS